MISRKRFISQFLNLLKKIFTGSSEFICRISGKSNHKFSDHLKYKINFDFRNSQNLPLTFFSIVSLFESVFRASSLSLSGHRILEFLYGDCFNRFIIFFEKIRQKVKTVSQARPSNNQKYISGKRIQASTGVLQSADFCPL